MCVCLCYVRQCAVYACELSRRCVGCDVCVRDVLCDVCEVSGCGLMCCGCDELGREFACVLIGCSCVCVDMFALRCVSVQMCLVMVVWLRSLRARVRTHKRERTAAQAARAQTTWRCAVENARSHFTDGEDDARPHRQLHNQPAFCSSTSILVHTNMVIAAETVDHLVRMANHHRHA